MSTTALLKNSTAVVKSSADNLPATRSKREYADFDAFVENADRLLAFFKGVFKEDDRLASIKFEWLEYDDRRPLDLEKAKREIRSAKLDVEMASRALAQFPRARKRLAEFKRDEKWYNRKELYEIKGKGKRAQWTLSRRVVSEQIALLLASFQNARPGTPKVFGKMVVEEVYANNPNACVLESACRRVRREKDFPPSIAEVLKAINTDGSAWGERYDLDEYDADEIRRDWEQAIAEAESMIGKAQAKFAEREAKEKAAEEKRKAYREAYERIPHEERHAYERGQRSRDVRPMPAMPCNYSDREIRAYAAGLVGQPIPGLEMKINGAGMDA
jgi:hypothetical protein